MRRAVVLVALLALGLSTAAAAPVPLASFDTLMDDALRTGEQTLAPR